MSNLVLGIDEAGRGPALGAMVLAAVALAPQASRRLSRAGVADSKSFGAGPDAHEARVEMAHRIREAAAFIAIEVCDVETIDAYVARGALNVLERERAERMIRLAPPCKRIIADGRKLFAELSATFTTSARSIGARSTTSRSRPRASAPRSGATSCSPASPRAMRTNSARSAATATPTRRRGCSRAPT